jgi:cell division protein FtsQ
VTGRLRTTLHGSGHHKRGRAGRGAPGEGPDLFDIEAVEADEAGGTAVAAEGAVRTEVRREVRTEVRTDDGIEGDPGAPVVHRLARRVTAGGSRLAVLTGNLRARAQRRSPESADPVGQGEQEDPVEDVDWGDTVDDVDWGDTVDDVDWGETVEYVDWADTVGSFGRGETVDSFDQGELADEETDNSVAGGVLLLGGADREVADLGLDRGAEFELRPDLVPDLAPYRLPDAEPVADLELVLDSDVEPHDEIAPDPGLEPAEDGWLPVDPRIEERRLSVIREASLRRTHVSVAALSVLTIAVFAVLAVHSAVFGVRHVRVRGAVHTDVNLIAADAGLDSSTPMVDVNSSAIAARLLRLPWVGTVRVTRQWPATVRIQITERTAVAIAPAVPSGGDGHWALLDQTGRVLEVTDTPPPGLLQLTGVASAGPPGTQIDANADAALAVAASLPPDLVEQLATVRPATKLRDDADTELTLRGGGVVLWGAPDDAGDKVVALRTVLVRVDLRRLTTIDVRVPDAPTVRRA